MFSISSAQKYYLYRQPTDMRKGFHGLSGLVRNELHRDPLSGDVFIFVNRRRNRMKLLVWDRTGFALYYKMLEKGTFELPMSAQGTCQLSWRQLVLIMEGVELASIRQRLRFSLPKQVGQRKIL